MFIAFRETNAGMPVNRVFLLSPAHSGGRRAALLLRPGACFELARQLQIRDASLGAVFAFCSGLYFRGKLAYARKFARPPEGLAGVQVITSNRGLVAADEMIDSEDLRKFGSTDVDAAEPRFAQPLAESAAALAALPSCEIVLLGSIATGKYVDVLLPILGERLFFPTEFIGRGDMSRGGLMLRCAAAGHELEYMALAGAIRRGRRAVRVEAMSFKPAPPV
jgi:hypothetical protein